MSCVAGWGRGARCAARLMVGAERGPCPPYARHSLPYCRRLSGSRLDGSIAVAPGCRVCLREGPDADSSPGLAAINAASPTVAPFHLAHGRGRPYRRIFINISAEPPNHASPLFLERT